MIDLQTYIHSYLKDFARISRLESYKWLAFRHYADNVSRKYTSLHDKLESVYGKTDNLLSSFRYYPLAVLLDIASENGRPEELNGLFEELLYNDRIQLSERVRRFIEGTDVIIAKMADDGFDDWKGRTNLQSFQDAHSVSVYLSLCHPNNFYIYKFGVFKNFASIVDYHIESRDAIDRLFEFQALCDCVKLELIKNDALVRFYRQWLTDHSYVDDNLNILTQDFIYAVVHYLNSESYRKIDNKKARVRLLSRLTTNQLKAGSSKTTGHSFKGVTGIDYKEIESKNSELGFSGEMWAVNYEKERLIELGISPDKVKHTSLLVGDGCGYDIESVEDDGVTKRYIEVKTTSGDCDSSIFFSNNELQFSKEHRDNYHLYRVYNFVSANKTADLLIIDASLDELPSEPVTYRSRIEY